MAVSTSIRLASAEICNSEWPIVLKPNTWSLGYQGDDLLKSFKYIMWILVDNNKCESQINRSSDLY